MSYVKVSDIPRAVVDAAATDPDAFNAIREARLACWSAGQSILEVAVVEGRTLLASEQRRFDRTVRDLDAFDALLTDVARRAGRALAADRAALDSLLECVK